MEVAVSSRTVKVVEASQPFAARSAVRDIALSAGFEDADGYRAGLVVTELATNLLKHTLQGGELLFRITTPQPAGEIEVIAVDSGPGMHDVARCMRDGQSSTGTAGNGLGAVRRLADEFDVHSDVGRGTAIVARLRAGRRAPESAPAFDVAAVSVAAPGEVVCGDAWHVRQHEAGLALLVADGLGHGLLAAEAARTARGIFDDGAYDGPSDMLQRLHAGLRPTRGAAAAIADIQTDRGVVRICGVGNVMTQINHATATRIAVSQNGTLGHQVRAFREYTYPWTHDALLVMHSDGLGSQWTLDPYPGLRQRHPALIAAVLYRDFTRGRDDVTVVVARKHS